MANWKTSIVNDCNIYIGHWHIALQLWKKEKPKGKSIILWVFFWEKGSEHRWFLQQKLHTLQITWLLATRLALIHHHHCECLIGWKMLITRINCVTKLNDTMYERWRFLMKETKVYNRIFNDAKAKRYFQLVSLISLQHAIFLSTRNFF